MDTTTARKLNAAACRIYFYKHGLSERLDISDVQLIRESSEGQIQSAIEVIEALNRDARSKATVLGEHAKTIVCTLAEDEIPRVLAYAVQLEI